MLWKPVACVTVDPAEVVSSEGEGMGWKLVPTSVVRVGGVGLMLKRSCCGGGYMKFVMGGSKCPGIAPCAAAAVLDGKDARLAAYDAGDEILTG